MSRPETGEILIGQLIDRIEEQIGLRRQRAAVESARCSGSEWAKTTSPEDERNEI